jgi:hypothetical protein
MSLTRASAKIRFSVVGLLPAVLLCTPMACSKDASSSGAAPSASAATGPGSTASQGPVIEVKGDLVLVDGTAAGSVAAVKAAGKVQKIDELFNRLDGSRKTWLQVHPQKDFPGTCVLKTDASADPIVVQSVTETAHQAGYPQVVAAH